VTKNSTDSLNSLFANALHTQRDFSAPALNKAQHCLTDFLACVYSTGHFPWVENARQVALQNSVTLQGGAPILGSHKRVSVQDAAFVNAVAGHSLIRDDMHLGSVSHLGVVVIPAALALAELNTITGKKLLEAIVCGYEAGGTLGGMLMDVETAKKIRPTGLIGAYAAAATGACLFDLDVNETANALGLATNYFTGLNEWANWGSEDMYFHPGIGVRNGITAVMLAKQGASAAAGSLEGKAGLFAAFGKKIPESPSLPFANTEEILQVFFKQVPACNYAQTAAQTAAHIGSKIADKSAVQEVIVDVPHAAAHYPGCDFSGPFTSILQARMSIQFNVASAILNGDFNDSHYQDFNNPGIRDLADKVTVKIDPALTSAYPTKQGAAILILTDTGEYREHLDDVIGADTEEVESRYLSAATTIHGQDKAKSLLEEIRSLKSRPDLKALLTMLAN